ncbi:ATP-binding protein, partial [uncultured Alsobacter sp.]|uniref:ATP-binding protein n=1 Tax=uncultured Alsobacter sp. TaxID=1748258 RepID=UPI0025F170BC
MSAEEACRRIVARLSGEPLLTAADGRALVRLADGPIPRIVAWTHEDKAAKGLRKLAADAVPQPPVHFTVAEMVQETPALLLTGEAGSGRTTLARHLAQTLAQARLAGAWPDAGPIARNDLGDALPEAWPGPWPLPVLLSAEPGATLAQVMARDGTGAPGDEPVLLVLDDVERAGERATALLAEASAWAAGRAGSRVLALADAAEAAGWRLPEGWTRLGMLPLLAAQRRRFVAAHGLAVPGEAPFAPAASNASLFALSLDGPGHGASEEAIVADWLATRGEAAKAFPALAAETLADRDADGLPPALRPRRVRQLLAAAGLAGEAPAAVAAIFAGAPQLWAPVVASLLGRAGPVRRDAVAAALVGLPG